MKRVETARDAIGDDIVLVDACALDLETSLEFASELRI